MIEDILSLCPKEHIWALQNDDPEIPMTLSAWVEERICGVQGQGRVLSPRDLYRVLKEVTLSCDYMWFMLRPLTLT